MTIWNSKELSEAIGVKINDDFICGEIQFNSKDVKLGDLFIAIEDGHLYVEEALNNGAQAAIIDQEIKVTDNNKVIKVKDTYLALTKMAEYKRRNSKAKFIAITGSLGKTTTKELVKILLEAFGKTYANRGNFNNYLGLIISLASMTRDCDFAIFEIGMNHAGEISELIKLLKPIDIVVITSISEAHIEFFDSLETIADAKSEIFEGLSKNGTVILNKDSSCYPRILDNLKQIRDSQYKLYNFGKDADIELKSFEYLDNKVRVIYKKKQNNNLLELETEFCPEHLTKNFGLALLVADSMNLNLTIASQQLKKFQQLEGRGKIVEIKRNGKNYKIISDYYNASPQSLKASLGYLEKLPHKNKVAIIGDMLELGKFSKKLHIDLVEPIIKSGLKKLLLVGTEVINIYNLLPDHIIKYHFKDVELLLPKLPELLGDDELILIKGSNGIKLKKVFEFITKV